MSLKEAFCVECGAEGVELKDGVCRTCRFGDQPLLSAVRPQVQVEVCKSCGAERRGDSWKDREDAVESYDRAAMGAVQILEAVEDPRFELAFEQTAPKTLRYTITMRGSLWDDPVEETAEVHVKIKTGICTTCSQRAGGYYEAVLQIRPPREASTHDHIWDAYRTVVDRLRAAREAGNRQAFVSKEQEVHGGIDLYIGDRQAARQAAKVLSDRYGARTGESHEQVGMKDGQPVMRAAVSVRLPPYAVGDFVRRDEELWRVDGFTKRLVALSRVPDGRTDHVDARSDELVPALDADAVRDAVVVSWGQGEAQVLDPDTMETVTVAVPGRTNLGEDLPVVKWRGQVLAVPP